MKWSTKRYLAFTAILLIVAAAIVIMIPKFVSWNTETSPQHGSSVTFEESTTSVSVAPKGKIVDLGGDWAGKTEKFDINATVAGEDILVSFTSKHGVTITYWYGSFKTTDLEAGVVTSHKEQTSRTVLSDDEMKKFSYNNETLTFDYTDQGKPVSVVMRRA